MQFHSELLGWSWVLIRLLVFVSLNWFCCVQGKSSAWLVLLTANCHEHVRHRHLFMYVCGLEIYHLVWQPCLAVASQWMHNLQWMWYMSKKNNNLLSFEWEITSFFCCVKTSIVGCKVSHIFDGYNSKSCVAQKQQESWQISSQVSWTAWVGYLCFSVHTLTHPHTHTNHWC